MKTLLAAAALALSLAGGVVATAHADGRDHRRDWRDEHGDRGRGHDRRDDRHDHRGHRNDRHWDDRASYRAGYIEGRHDQRRYDRGRYARPRGYYYRAWRYGDRLPPAYYSRRYIVHDYHVYRLRPPPRGYHWVRVDNDVILAAIATGLVVHAVNDIFY